jgi:hypothetical protein
MASRLNDARSAGCGLGEFQRIVLVGRSRGEVGPEAVGAAGDHIAAQLG